MEIIDVAILGIIQGVTEFLPVSSSGHLVLGRLLFNISDTAGTATDAFLHLGTLLAVLIYYWRVWWGILRGLFVRDVEGNDKRQLFGKLIIATVPAALAGYFLAGMVDRIFRGPATVALGFAITGVAFLIAEGIGRRRSVLPRAGWLEASVTGIAQVLALIPGVSRSGITIAAGQSQGLSRSQAAHFSFLMSVPIIAGAGLGTLPSLLSSHAHSAAALLLGFLTSFIAGLIAIHLLVGLTRRISFIPFALYLFVVAGLLAVLF